MYRYDNLNKQLFRFGKLATLIVKPHPWYFEFTMFGTQRKTTNHEELFLREQAVKDRISTLLAHKWLVGENDSISLQLLRMCQILIIHVIWSQGLFEHITKYALCPKS